MAKGGEVEWPAHKTNYLGLNKFVGSDKPKMDDF